MFFMCDLSFILPICDIIRFQLHGAEITQKWRFYLHHVADHVESKTWMDNSMLLGATAWSIRAAKIKNTKKQKKATVWMHFQIVPSNVPNFTSLWQSKQQTTRKTMGEKGERDVWDQGGEAFSTWDCPRWTQAAPSLYKQPASLLCQSLLLSFMPVVHNSAPTVYWTSAENIKKLTLSVFTFLFWQFICPHQHPSLTPHPPIHAISKVNTPLNAGLTHFHCGWLCFQFSHQLSHPTTLEETWKKTFVQKTKKVAKQTCKREMHKKHACRCRGETWGQNQACFSHFFCGSEMVIAAFLPFFLFGRAWERPQSAAEKPRGS